jgi:hypothetical protein
MEGLQDETKVRPNDAYITRVKHHKMSYIITWMLTQRLFTLNPESNECIVGETEKKFQLNCSNDFKESRAYLKEKQSLQRMSFLCDKRNEKRTYSWYNMKHRYVIFLKERAINICSLLREVKFRGWKVQSYGSVIPIRQTSSVGHSVGPRIYLLCLLIDSLACWCQLQNEPSSFVVNQQSPNTTGYIS